MRLKFLWLWLLSMVLTGCATIEYPKQDFVGVYGRVMTVESVENVTGDAFKIKNNQLSDDLREKFRDYGINTGGMFNGNGFSQRLYKLRDHKGRSFYAIEGYSNIRFSVGECVNYWMSNTILNPYYPRLSKAGPNCSLLASEPDPEKIYRYIVTKRMYIIRRLDSWLDVPVEKLIEKWGKPTEVTKKAENIYELGYYNGFKREIYINGYYNHSNTFECTQYFTVKNRIIESWRYSGNNCEVGVNE